MKNGFLYFIVIFCFVVFLLVAEDIDKELSKMFFWIMIIFFGVIAVSNIDLNGLRNKISNPNFKIKPTNLKIPKNDLKSSDTKSKLDMVFIKILLLSILTILVSEKLGGFNKKKTHYSPHEVRPIQRINRVYYEEPEVDDMESEEETNY